MSLNPLKLLCKSSRYQLLSVLMKLPRLTTNIGAMITPMFLIDLNEFMLNLERVIDGGNVDNMIKLIMRSLMEYGGLDI